MRSLVLGTAIALAAALGAGCEQPPGGPPPPPHACVWQGGERPEVLYELGCAEDYEWVKSVPLTPIFGETDSVKVMVDLSEEDLVLFIDGERWYLHFDYVVEERSYCEDHGFQIVRPPTPADPIYQDCRSAFNQTEYFSEDRQYLFASIEHYRALDLYTIEFAPGDQITTAQILHAFRAISARMWIRDTVRLRPSSQLQEERMRELADEVPMTSYGEVFEGQTYQPLNAGVSFGYLRHLPDEEAVGTATQRDIVLTDTVPTDISVVAGLITGEFQAPLSHVNVLSHNRGTPNMALRDARDDPRVGPFVDQLVRLEVGLQEFSIEPASLEDAEAYWSARRPPEPNVPPFDLSVTQLVDLADVRARHPPPTGDEEPAWIPVIGAKATNFGELMHVEGIPTVEAAFAIPVYFYEQHVVDNGIDVEIDEMLEDPDFQTDLANRRARLAELRERIATAPVSTELEDALGTKLEAEFPHTRMRYRSSSNAEDLQGFNGAGLYASHAGSLDEGIDDVTGAVRATWASLWNDRAFEERDYYRIDHRATKMGVLCHHSFQDEIANGVAITRNPFREGSRAYFVNAQLGDVSVVFSEAVPEQFLYYGFDPPEIEYLSHSSLTFGARVLSAEEITELVAALQRIHVHFYQYFGVGLPQSQYGMDVEWKFDADGALFIKQARPYMR
jgi:hypothetical protein